LVDRPRLWGSETVAGGKPELFERLAASLPGWTRITASKALYQSRYLSNSGRLFFNAADSLAPVDSNGTEDVYEYEPPASAPGQPASTPRVRKPPASRLSTAARTCARRMNIALSTLLIEVTVCSLWDSEATG